MSLNILVVTASSAEADVLRKIPGINEKSGIYSFGNHRISLLVTGVGSMAVSWAMTKWLSSNPMPDLALNAGIAGSYREDIIIGEVVIPVSDCFADAGIETGNGFITLAEAGLEEAQPKNTVQVGEERVYLGQSPLHIDLKTGKPKTNQ